MDILDRHCESHLSLGPEVRGSMEWTLELEMVGQVR